MMPRPKSPPDFLIVISAAGLLAIGIVMVFSSSSYAAWIEYGDIYYYLKRQLAWAGIGLVFLVVAYHVPYYRWSRLAKPLLGLSLLLLVVVLVSGVTAGGSSRWIALGPINFQPSELVKLTLVIYMAGYLTRIRDRLQFFKRGMVPPLLILVLVCALILAQPDLGTAVTLAATVYLMLFVAGARREHLVLLAVVGIAAVLAAALGASYRVERLTGFLDPEADPTGTGFQTLQSLYALGSGGFSGLGLGNSRQKYLYVPERHTDFLFAILGEELGFIGALLVLILFLILFWRGLEAALRAPDEYGSMLATGLVAMIAVQMLINVGVVTGMLPVTGITLPLLSYGGSSLVLTLTAIGILLNISQYSWRG